MSDLDNFKGDVEEYSLKQLLEHPNATLVYTSNDRKWQYYELESKFVKVNRKDVLKYLHLEDR